MAETLLIGCAVYLSLGLIYVGVSLISTRSIKATVFAVVLFVGFVCGWPYGAWVDLWMWRKRRNGKLANNI